MSRRVFKCTVVEKRREVIGENRDGVKRMSFLAKKRGVTQETERLVTESTSGNSIYCNYIAPSIPLQSLFFAFILVYDLMIKCIASSILSYIFSVTYAALVCTVSWAQMVHTIARIEEGRRLGNIV